MMRTRIGGFIIASFWILIFPFQSSAQTSDDLFNGDILHEVRLYMNPADFATLKLTNFICPVQDLQALAGQVVSAVPRVECHFPVEFHWIFNGKDIASSQVGLSSHGVGSRSNIKPSFKIDFSRYASQNTFLGLRSVILRGNTQDASQMHEGVAMTFFRKLGVVASREAHARVFLNDQYAGLYTIVEDVDPVFLERNFGESDGYLYNYEWVGGWLLDYRGPETSKYSPLPLKPENNLLYLHPDPIVQMVSVINKAPDAQFSAAVSQYIDLNALFREIAAENFIAEQDGIIGDFTLNNFYLYRFQNTVRSIFIPWDKSQTFYTINWDIFHNFDSGNVLVARARAVAPDLMAIYKDTLRQATALAGPGGWLEQEITKESQQIRQAVYDDQLKLCYGVANAKTDMHPCSNDEFEGEVSYMLQFARQRAGIVLGQLAGQ